MAIELDDTGAVVIVGSGAGGGTLAGELCARGVRVVLLEAGPRIPSSEFRNDEAFAFQQLSWRDPRQATGTWATARLSPDTPAWMVKAVGGSTLHWNGLSYRIQPREFRARTEYGAIDDANLADWPLSAEELDPYYSAAEKRLGVTGTHGIPAHPPNNNFRVLAAGARRIGYRQVANDRQAINSEPRDGRPACLQLGFCNQGCRIDAKWTAANSEVPRAERTGRLDLRPGAMALTITVNEKGRVDGVIYSDSEGRRQRQRARVVCVAGNAIETPRVLLNSATAAWPDGLANSSGQVGRNYMHHVAALAFAVFERPVHMHRGITVPGTVFDESGHDPARGFAGGYLMEAAAAGPAFLSALIDPGGWGPDFAALMERYDHMAGVLLNGEDLPREDNRVSLHSSAKDQHGLPIPVVHVDEHTNDVAMREHFFRQVRRLYEAVGAVDVRDPLPLSSAHNLGTCRMSAKSGDGVVNRFGQTHDIDNLFVSDGSQFTTSSSENPTLTIVALALRQAEYLAGELGRRNL
ncbi:MAG: GMC family oxidoreductase [Chromatiales bacterium]|nr:MAG: GMC family oxidoreductase [Chromatiales bacterium]